VTLILGNDDVARLLTMEICIAALEEGYHDLAKGIALTRPRSDCLAPTKRGDAVYGLKSMDGIVPSAGVGAVRINSDIITWPREQGTLRRVKVPAAPGARYVGLVLLFSTENGEPLAIFPDGVLQRLRVGATNGLGAKYLARRDCESVALLGSGWQAGTQLLAICAVRPVKRVRCFSPNPDHRAAFVAEMAPQIAASIEAVESPEAAVAGADVVLCATNAIEPVFFARWIEPGMHLSAIKRPEIEPAAIARADHLFIHTSVSTPQQVIAEGLDILPERYTDDREERAFAGLPLLADLIAGGQPGRRAASEITCFINNLGMGFQFAAAGAALYRQALAAGAGHALPTEWFTQDVHP
jgi:alanine dehydrogenase